MRSSIPPPRAHEDAGLTGELAALLGARRASLTANLVQFSRALVAAGLDVTHGRLIDAAGSLALIDLAHPDDFRVALRANLVSRREDFATYDALFRLYWRGDDPGNLVPAPVERLPRRIAAARRDGTAVQAATSGDAQQAATEAAPRSYNSVDALTIKDFSQFDDDDVEPARRVLRQMAPKLASALSRRSHASVTRGAVDLRRSLRRSSKYGGEVVELLRRQRRVKRLNLVVICDVSGSMDVYSQFLLQFLYAMQSEFRRVSTFAFSTRLHEVTHALRTQSFDEALAHMRAEVDSWSGGTSIGLSLSVFDQHYAGQRLNSRSVVIIISDGWDRGDVSLIERAMRSIRRRAYKIIWLNPLLGDRDYQPVAKGMAAALPFIDYFLPAHNLESLARAGRTLVRLARS